MERAFFHPSMGAWIAINDPSPETMASYPEGTQETSLPPGIGWAYDGTDWTPPASGTDAPVPDSISGFQFRAWLVTNGKWEQALQIAEAHPNPLAVMALHGANEVDRDSALLAEMSPHLGLDGPATDQAFRDAAKIKL